MSSLSSSSSLLSTASEMTQSSTSFEPSESFYSNISNVLTLPSVKVSDTLDGLSIVCYSRECEMSHNSDHRIQKCRGLVYDEHGKLFSQAFGYTPMFTLADKSWSVGTCEDFPDFADVSEGFVYLPQYLKQYMKEHKCKMYPSIEGCLVRVFNFNGKWYLTTHRKLDAFKSYWGCRTSFGDMFVNCLKTARETNAEFDEKCKDFGYCEDDENLLEVFYSLLNPAHQYVFLVSTCKENRIVCSPPAQQYAIHVATYKNGEEIEETILGIPSQSPIQGLEDFDDVVDYICGSDPFVYQGVVVFLPNGRHFKICSPQYTSLYNLRGNEASVMFRYLQVRTKYQYEFVRLYPEYSQRFQTYEDAIVKVSQKIFEMYKARFVHHMFLKANPEEFAVMSTAHTNFQNGCANKVKQNVTVEHILEILNRQSATNINKMIRKVLMEEKGKPVEDC